MNRAKRVSGGSTALAPALPDQADVAPGPTFKRKPMSENNQPEIPQAMRDLIVKNIDEARSAYGQLLDAARKAQEAIRAFVPPVAGQVLNDVQEKALRFTRQNVDASFALASDLTKATDLAEVLHVQSKQAQEQMHAYALQAKELTDMVNGAAQKATSSS